MSGPADAAATVRREIEIVNEKGLHARASAKLAKLAESFDAEIEVARDGLTVSAASIMGLLMLAASKGSTIAVEAQGPDAETAVRAVADLVSNRFDEPR